MAGRSRSVAAAEAADLPGRLLSECADRPLPPEPQPVPTASLSPARTRLAAAIDQHNAAAYRLAVLENGRNRASLERSDARHAIADAQRDLEEARRYDAGAIVQSYLGGEQTTISPVDEVRRRQREAEETLERNDRVIDALGFEIAQATRDLHAAIRVRTAALDEVIRDEIIPSLATRYKAASAERDVIATLLRALPGVYEDLTVIPQHGWDPDACRIAQQGIRQQLLALETDPAAPLGLDDGTADHPAPGSAAP
jgi:hypothetical protein